LEKKIKERFYKKKGEEFPLLCPLAKRQRKRKLFPLFS